MLSYESGKKKKKKLNRTESRSRLTSIQGPVPKTHDVIGICRRDAYSSMDGPYIRFFI